jgi:hypothetical protein
MRHGKSIRLRPFGGSADPDAALIAFAALLMVAVFVVL